ncbi:unnamed protein product [Rotaria sp. Silwood1]|nr:unnamed protein product [Rotaria sp. Silwood1]CAF4703217.1 unnamed protein product [Rotaria sp. Silwood1]
MINNHDKTENNLDWIKQTIALIEQNLDQLKYIQYQLHALEIDKSIISLPPPMKDIQIPSFSQGIKDICWWETLDRFIFISSKEIFTLDEETMVLNPYNIYFNTDSAWERVTCSESPLFLLTFGQNSFIHFQR